MLLIISLVSQHHVSIRRLSALLQSASDAAALKVAESIVTPGARPVIEVDLKGTSNGFELRLTGRSWDIFMSSSQEASKASVLLVCINS